MVRIVVNGVGGKMGREVVAAALGDGGVCIVGAFEAGRSPLLGKVLSDVFGAGAPEVEVTEQRRSSLLGADVVVDFSVPSAVLSLLDLVKDLSVCLVIGTTGFDKVGLAAIQEASETHPVLLAPNMSVGINALFEVVPYLMALLGEGWDIDIIESHHRDKVDSPSGTALRLGEVIAEGRGRSHGRTASREAKHGGPREDGAIVFHCVRAGEIPGEHSLVLSRGEEEVIITHRVHGRRVFAAGAIAGAKGLLGKEPGLYDFRKLMGGKSPS